MIETRLLHYALVLGQHRNFARAAEALGITQPSLSRSIASLERSLGVQLFDRTTRGAAPTAFGRVLLERGEALLRGEAGLRRELELLAGLDGGELVISAGPYYAERIVALAIGRLSRAHPRLRIRCMSATPPQVARIILDEQADVGAAAISNIEDDPRLQVEALPAHRMYLACRPGHPLTAERALTIPRVLRFPLVTTVLVGDSAVLAGTGREPRTPGEARGATFIPPILVGTVAAARTIARESDAVVPGGALALADEVAAGRLVLLDVSLPHSMDLGGTMYLRERTLSPAASELIALLREVSREEVREADARMAEALRASRRRIRVGAAGRAARAGAGTRRYGRAADKHPA